MDLGYLLEITIMCLVFLKNQNLKNKIPRTGALRSFFKNENYNFDS